MQNVTDLISLAKPGTQKLDLLLRSGERVGYPHQRILILIFLCVHTGSYTCQIFWKGDPSIENFIIRFTTEEVMKKWAQQVEAQRRKYRDRSARGSEGNRSLGTSTTEFEFMRHQALENPYAQQFAQDEEEEEDDDVDTLVGSGVGLGVPMPGYGDSELGSRNGSFTSLTSRADSAAGRQQPAGRFAQGLSLRTRDMAQSGTAEIPPESYFSPLDGSPNTIGSSRTSASSGMYGAFPVPVGQQLRAGQNGTPVGCYEDGQYHPNSSRFTAPAIARQREPSVVSIQQQPAPGRPPPRPGMHSATQMPGQPRNRSASSGDIHNQPRPPLQASMPPPPQGQPPVPNMPAPYQQNPALIPRSQSNSPCLNGIAPPPRGQNVSPQMLRDRERAWSRQQYKQNSGIVTPTPGTAFPPPPGPPPAPPGRPSSGEAAHAEPTQLKVKVHCKEAAQTLTLVVPLNISYQSLKDRIDAKLQRSTNLSLSDRSSTGQDLVKLKFADEGDLISIQSDEDVQTAFETWQGAGGGMAEVELYCLR